MTTTTYSASQIAEHAYFQNIATDTDTLGGWMFKEFDMSWGEIDDIVEDVRAEIVRAAKNLPAAETVYVVIVDNDTIDIIQTGKVETDQHAKDLRKMGFEVKVKAFDGWDAANAFEEKWNATH